MNVGRCRAARRRETSDGGQVGAERLLPGSKKEISADEAHGAKSRDVKPHPSSRCGMHDDLRRRDSRGDSHRGQLESQHALKHSRIKIRTTISRRKLMNDRSFRMRRKTVKFQNVVVG